MDGSYFRNPSDALYKNLQLAVPLVLQDKKLDFAKQMSDLNFERNKQLLFQEVQQTKDKIAMENAIEQYQNAFERGDRKTIETIAPQLESMGLPVLRTGGQRETAAQVDPSGMMQMTEAIPGMPYVPEIQPEGLKPPKTLEEVIARSVTPEQAKKILEKFKSVSKSTGPKTFENMLVSMFPDKPEKVLEYLSRLKKITGGATSQQKELQRIEDDIMSISSKIASIESGQDIMSEAIGSSRPKVVEDQVKRLFMLLKQYKSKGGDPKRLGFDLEELEKQEKQQDVMAEMPNPSEHKGKVIRDTETGKRYKSDGKKWVEIK